MQSIHPEWSINTLLFEAPQKHHEHFTVSGNLLGSANALTLTDGIFTLTLTRMSFDQSGMRLQVRFSEANGNNGHSLTELDVYVLVATSNVNSWPEVVEPIVGGIATVLIPNGEFTLLMDEPGFH